MSTQSVQEFQRQFRDWLGPEPEETAVIVARLSGYSVKYVRWAAGLIGNGTWPGSRRFIRRMQRLGCTSKPWRDRTADQIAQAFACRETLHDPNGRGSGG